MITCRDASMPPTSTAARGFSPTPASVTRSLRGLRTLGPQKKSLPCCRSSLSKAEKNLGYVTFSSFSFTTGCHNPTNQACQQHALTSRAPDHHMLGTTTTQDDVDSRPID